jgi:hypothetical protein
MKDFQWHLRVLKIMPGSNERLNRKPIKAMLFNVIVVSFLHKLTGLSRPPTMLQLL